MKSIVSNSGVRIPVDQVTGIERDVDVATGKTISYVARCYDGEQLHEIDEKTYDALVEYGIEEIEP